MKRTLRSTLLSLTLAALATGVVAVALPAPLSAAAADDARAPHSDRYRAGQRALADERWSDALETFSAIAAERGAEADAALYWKAWAQSKLDRRAEALTTIATLESTYPKSSWLGDARALEIQIRGSRGAEAGAGVSAGRGASAGTASASSDDEDLQLYALDSLMQADPVKAVPILERFLTGDHPVKLKKRALFVLSQSDSPRAREILLDTVRRGDPPELRVEAVRDLGVAGGDENLAALSGIWKGASPEVKAAVLDAWMIADQSAPVLEAARSEADPGLRAKAIDQLGAMDASKELVELYGAEKDPELRGKILGALGVAGDVADLAKVVKSEADPKLRGQAIEAIGIAGGPAATEQLKALYAGEKDRAVRERILNAFMISGDAHSLVALFRQEKDPQLKRKIVQVLSFMDDPESQALLEELLGAKS